MDEQSIKTLEYDEVGEWSELKLEILRSLRCVFANPDEEEVAPLISTASQGQGMTYLGEPETSYRGVQLMPHIVPPFANTISSRLNDTRDG